MNHLLSLFVASLVLLEGITANPAPINVKFFMNVQKIENNHPFVATCEISGYTPAADATYQVRFDRSEGSLASYDFKSPNEANKQAHTMIFTATNNADIVATVGDHQANPKFDVKLDPKSVKADDYSCSLIITTGKDVRDTHTSEKWHSNSSFATFPSVIFVAFTMLISLKYAILA